MNESSLSEERHTEPGRRNRVSILGVPLRYGADMVG
jgi:hypothetical protein